MPRGVLSDRMHIIPFQNENLSLAYRVGWSEIDLLLSSRIIVYHFKHYVRWLEALENVKWIIFGKFRQIDR